MQREKTVPWYMAAMTYWPLLFLLCGGLLAAAAADALRAVTLFAIWLYLIPPLLCRGTVAWFGSPETAGAGPQQRAFKVWWFLTQLQMPFNRIGLLEDLLRLVPGLYSSWLNLWGAKVSLMTFWTRDVIISERYLLTIEPGVTLASQSGITAHIVTPGEDGELKLLVAPVVIERGAVVGIRAGLGPGCRLFAGELLPAGRMLPPWTGWKEGRRVRLARPEPQPARAEI